MKYKANYIWNIVCLIVFLTIAGIDIVDGRMWHSLMWLFNSFLCVAGCFFLQNQEKIEKMDEIKELLKNKEDEQ